MKRSTFLATMLAPFVALRLGFKPVRSPYSIIGTSAGHKTLHEMRPDGLPQPWPADVSLVYHKFMNGWWRISLTGSGDAISRVMLPWRPHVLNETKAETAANMRYVWDCGRPLTLSWFEKTGTPATGLQLEAPPSQYIETSANYVRKSHANFINSSGMWERARNG